LPHGPYDVGIEALVESGALTIVDINAAYSMEETKLEGHIRFWMLGTL
jgi:hypothetical protein